MNENLKNNNQPANEMRIPKLEPIKPSKKKWLKDLFWCILGSVGVFILFVALIWMYLSPVKQATKKKDYEKAAIESIRMNAVEPESVKITSVSEKLDSVFANRLCPEYELEELTEYFMQKTVELMQLQGNTTLDNYDDPKRQSLFDSFSVASTSIGEMNELMTKPKGEFCGWRLKVEYSSVDKHGQPFKSEKWLIFDKDKKHILKSFDIPIL